MSIVTNQNNSLIFNKSFAITLQRTLRIPDDGNTYPLPPGLGRFPICRVHDCQATVPPAWLEHGGVFIPMYQREAMWLSLQSLSGKPHALKIAVGKVNAVSGKHWDQQLRAGENDYLVSPPQPWLDGINTGTGHIRQFVAMPLGMGYTVEGQVTGQETFGGIQIIVYAPKPGQFPDRIESPQGWMTKAAFADSDVRGASSSGEMGLAAGGKMKQKIYPDPHGIGTWDETNYSRVYIHIVNSLMYREITGQEPPSTPITAKTYAQQGLPWFDIYDDNMGDIESPTVLQQVKPVKEMDKQQGYSSQQDDEPVNVPAGKVVKYKIADKSEVVDGHW